VGVKAFDPARAAQPIAVSGAGTSAPLVGSEVGRLRSVLLHRPGDELRAVDPANASRMLFAGPMHVEAAQAEHDAFASTLRARGAEVLYVEDLLAEIAADQPGRRALARLALPRAPSSLHRRIELLAPHQVARALIAGMDADPLPNLLFIRDPSAWVGPGVVVGTMATAVRARETRCIGCIHGSRRPPPGPTRFRSRPASRAATSSWPVRTASWSASRPAPRPPAATGWPPPC
jgi:arginine deiminase